MKMISKETALGLVIPPDQFARCLGLLRDAQISSDRRENRKLWSQLWSIQRIGAKSPACSLASWWAWEKQGRVQGLYL